MNRLAAAPPIINYAAAEGTSSLLRRLILLSAPVLAEQVLHWLVGANDTYLANHVKEHRADAVAAVGTIMYLMWFTGLVVAAIATGSMALISRARGARHRSLANAACGQSILAALMLGTLLGVVIYTAAPWIVPKLTGLQGKAQEFALLYLRLLAFALPFSITMFVANACLRGAGDTLTPAIAMIVVDIVNILATFSLTRGWGPLPEMGFKGIALGTCIAYITGGIMQVTVLLHGIGGIRLHLHRLRPNWPILYRVLRIGVPAGTEGLLQWIANFVILVFINRFADGNVSAAAHANAIRIESMSFLPGFAVAIAASTLVGQSLGMRAPGRAKKCAYLALAVGGGIMTLGGAVFILFGRALANWMSDDPAIADLTARCLFITGWIQTGFAASIIFSGALRGAGDTLAVMVLNLTSILGIRFLGVLIAVKVLGGGLLSVWLVLAGELFVRGMLMYGRFLQGGWRHARV